MTNKEQDDAAVEEAIDTPLSPTPGGMEREVFGKWTLILRNSAGFFAVIIVCLMGAANCYTTYISVSDHQEWPSELSVFIMVVGPIAVAWQFMAVSKILNTVFTGVGDITRIRERVAGIIAPDKKDPQ